MRSDRLAVLVVFVLVALSGLALSLLTGCQETDAEVAAELKAHVLDPVMAEKQAAPEKADSDRLSALCLSASVVLRSRRYVQHRRTGVATREVAEQIEKACNDQTSIHEKVSAELDKELEKAEKARAEAAGVPIQKDEDEDW